MATDNDFFTNVDWSKLQQQYVDAVSSFYSNAGQTSNNPINNNAWKDAMEFWWKSVAGQVPDNNKQVFDSILDQSRVFYSISEQFANLSNDIANNSKGPDDWQRILNSHLENMKSMFDQFQNNANFASMAPGTMPGMMPGMMWSSPMEMWNQAMSSIVPDESIDKFLQMPGVGLTKDLQEKNQKTLRLWNEYQTSSQKYNAAFAMLGKQALDRLGETILARAESDKKISSLKEIYNLWIDANEDVFADYAQTEEYSTLYAGLVNSLVRFKRHYNELTDDVLNTFNLPTSEGVGSITKQQQAMKKELRSNREAQQKLAEAMGKLQADLEKLKGNAKSTQKKTVTKKASRKKTKAKSVKKSSARKSAPKRKTVNKTK